MWWSAATGVLERQPLCGSDLVEVLAQIVAAEVRKTVVVWARLDVAVFAGEIAQRPGVDPQRTQLRQRDARAKLAVSSHGGVCKLIAARLLQDKPHGACLVTGAWMGSLGILPRLPIRQPTQPALFAILCLGKCLP